VSTGTHFVTVANRMLVFNAHAQLTATVAFVPAVKPNLINNSGLGILPDGDLIVGSGNGLLRASLSNGTTVNLLFPLVSCPDRSSISIPVLPSGTPTLTPFPAGSRCAQAPQLVASDGAGDVWLFLGDQTEIDVVEGVESR